MFPNRSLLNRGIRLLVSFFITTSISVGTIGCAYMSQGYPYKIAAARPPELEKYYSKGHSYTHFTEIIDKHEHNYTIKKILVDSAAGQISIDYYALKKPSDSLILVFPVLGGKNIIADYFAGYFARNGYDTAIINRVNDFKDPKNFDHLEEVFRKGIVRDRIALDFFERQYHKTRFGTFGISRGAINVAMTAGVDSRLKYNVMAMGGTDLVALFKHTNVKGITKYRKKVMEATGITKEEFFKHLEDTIKTDPKLLAQYIDPKNTLMFLSIFDKTVPIKYGERLREQVGKPKTVYLFADHFTSLLYTQYLPILLPKRGASLFPFDYIESESLAFYNKSFHNQQLNPWIVPFRILQFPFNVIVRLFH